MKINDIRKFEPCYDPDRWCSDVNRDFTIMEVLQQPDIPSEDKIWMATRKGVLPDLTLRKFAIWCARQYESIKEIRDYVDVLERFYIFKTATEEEMNEACNVAHSAAYWAAHSAAGSAAYWAAHSAAHRAAHRAAYWAAYRADSAADRAAYRKQQVLKLIELIKEDGV